jgi:tRNA 2-thiouridine synthesizing protein E
MNQYPHAPQGWSQEDAQSVAQKQGISLTDDHWSVIRAVQEYFAKHDKPERNRREITDALDELFHIKGGLKYLYRLLPGGPVTQACQLAGIQPPAGNVDASFGSVV